MLYIVKACRRLSVCNNTSPHTLKLFIHTSLRTANKTATASKHNHEQTPVQHVVAMAQAPAVPPSTSVAPPTTPSLKNKPPEPDWIPVTLDIRLLPKHYLKLSKSRLTMLVVLTSMAGYAMAPAPFDLTSFALCSVGTGLLSSAANAINQYHEVPFDSQMARTKNRVIVKGHVSPLHALSFAAVCASSGLTILYCGINPLTAGLGLTNLILYTSIYTPLKRISITNTWVGSVVGALPPMMGWAACSGGLEAGAWVMAGILYAWQFPHFNALSWNLRPDYSRAGYRMMSVTNPGLCRRTTLRYTAALIPLAAVAPWVDLTNNWFAYASLPLNAYFLYLSWKFYQKSDSASSRKLFRFSLVHLPTLMLLLLVTKKHWLSRKDEPKTGAAVAAAAPSSTPLSLPLVVKPAL